MTSSKGRKRPVILGIFAHPDDESFGPGGTLARYAGTGAEVHVIIATDGIAGSVEEGADLKDHDSLAQVRSAELANAAVRLGVSSIWSLPYRDSGMRGSADNDHADALIRQPVNELVAEMLDAFNRLQPQVVITHDPYGG
ncbi:MAG: PIG-L deacetylase family protein, partial [Caldilineaceae bacterium]